MPKIKTAADIKKLREERGWSTATVAEICQCSPRTVEGWEQGRTPSPAAIFLLQDYQKKDCLHRIAVLLASNIEDALKSSNLAPEVREYLESAAQQAAEIESYFSSECD